MVEGALNRLGLAKPDLLAPHVDRLCHWLEHEDWWLRKAALTAVGGLAADERFYQKLLPLIGKVAAENRSNIMSFKLAGNRQQAVRSIPGGAGIGRKVIRARLRGVPGQAGGSRRSGSDECRRVPGRMSSLSTLAKQPDGLDLLLALGRQTLSRQAPAAQGTLLECRSRQIRDRHLKKKVFAIVRDQLIPEYVANNFAPLLGEVRPEPVVADPKQQAKVEELVALYDKMEVNDYDWQAFGPAWDGMRWDYFSFDPPETMPWDPGVTRYRKVTYPAGMENWFATDFDAKKAGWQNGLQPFGQENGKLRTEPKPYIRPVALAAHPASNPPAPSPIAAAASR